MYAKGLKKLEVPERLSIGEAAGVFEVWMKDRALHSGECFCSVCKFEDANWLGVVSNDELFLAKYSEASGNPRDFVWRGLLGTVES
jgi:small subunit ribosomal protein S29